MEYYAVATESAELSFETYFSLFESIIHLNTLTYLKWISRFLWTGGRFDRTSCTCVQIILQSACPRIMAWWWRISLKRFHCTAVSEQILAIHVCVGALIFHFHWARILSWFWSLVKVTKLFFQICIKTWNIDFVVERKNIAHAFG